MNKKTKILIVILVIALIVGLIIIISLNKNKEEDTNVISDNPDSFEINEEEEGKLQEVSDRDTYFIVKSCIEKFFLSYTEIYGDTSYYEDDEEFELDIDEQDLVKYVYCILDDSYLKYNNITLENFKSKFGKINGQKVSISSMYQKKANDDIYLYFVRGSLRDKETYKTSDFEIIVEQDTENGTYKMILQDYIFAKYGSIDKIIKENLKVEYPETIKDETYNRYDNQNISDEEYLREIFAEYRDLLVYDRQAAYNKLDEEYRNKRFGDYNSFDEYVKENALTLIVMNFNRYQTNDYKDYTQYVAIDSNNNYYIFNEKGIMNYSVILDQYTIDLPQFTEKYNQLTDENKARMNVEKVVQALNAADYKYIYNKLDETFKVNNYSNLDKLVQYMKQNLYEKNSYKNVDLQIQNYVYAFSMKVSDSSGKVAGSKTMNVIIKLEENNDFTMSFSIK